MLSQLIALQLIGIVICCPNDYGKTVIINGTEGQDSPDCISDKFILFPCKTLNYALESARNNTQYQLSTGKHYLNTSLALTNSVYLSIIGSGLSYNDTVIQCTNHESGLSFNRSSSLCIANISLVNCSFNTGVTNENAHWYRNRAALFFFNCSNVSLCDIRISYSSNASALVMLDTVGVNKVISSRFDHNGPLGRGVHVHTSENCSSNSTIKFLFQFCIFDENSVVNNRDNESCVPLQRHYHKNTYGGGMSIILQSNRTKVQIHIEYSRFIRNEAKCGGGLFLNIEYSSVNNNIQLRNCVFHNNWCFIEKIVTFGGGIRLEHLNSNSTQGSNSVTLDNCTLSNNRASSGGGLSISPIAHTDMKEDLLRIEIRDSSFIENRGNAGTAVCISLLALRIQTKPPTFIISNTKFTENRIEASKEAVYHNGVGAVYTNKVPISFEGNIQFTDNFGSALAVVGTYVAFINSTALFTRNHGANGGAIVLLGAADLIVNDYSDMIFDSNHASLQGGAIYNAYIEQENLNAYFNCFARPVEVFIHPDKWQASFTFINNSAAISGKTIFSTSILPCRLNRTENILCLPKQWLYYRNGTRVNCTDEITTEPGWIDNALQHDISTIPGKVSSLHFRVFDDLGHEIRNLTVFAAHVKPEGNNSSISIDSQYSYISGETLVLNGLHSSKARVRLYTIGGRSWHVHFNASLLNCPPGFVPSTDNSSSKCVCHKNYTYRGTLTCSQTRFESFLSSGYWMGRLKVNESIEENPLVVTLCPSGYCSIKESGVKFNVTTPEGLENICKNSSGISCGVCNSGYGHAVNSDIPTCVDCKKEKMAIHIVMYIFTVYAPLLLLFSCMIIFGVRLTTGSANAFIFYSQVISSNFNIDADGHIKLDRFLPHSVGLKKAYRLPYGLFNLEFIENLCNRFCINSDLNALDVLQLDYGVALTPLAMILIVLLCFKLRKCCKRIAPSQVTTTAENFLTKWKSGENLLHAFAAFWMLSYTKLGLTSAYIIRSNPVYNATGWAVESNRVYFAGQFAMKDEEYQLKYFFPAIIVLVIITLPPLFLLHYPVIWFEKCLISCPGLWKRYPADKVHILLDIFQGCYKDNRRFFAGIYFLFRYSINIVYISTHDSIQRFMSQQIACTIFIVLVAVCWPYKEELNFLNYVDLLILGNLAIINALSFYIYFKLNGQTVDFEPSTAFIIQYILVFIPLLYMLCYLVWSLVGQQHKKSLSNCINLLLGRTTSEDELADNLNKSDHDDLSISPGRQRDGQQRNRPTVSEVLIEESDNENYDNAHNEDELLFARSRRRNTYKAMPPSASHSKETASEGRKDCDKKYSGASALCYSDPSPLVPILNLSGENKPKVKSYGTN
ncbi:uncharacterized protein LOC135346270 [Halichondria panicea]|uniref:uncharacterized protein LOC135346270 n=1 Tax=Halichondria panicea TaxID=6063 RepID=UPI00312B72B7